MRLDVWLPMYREICSDFGFSEEEDVAGAVFLSGALKEDSRETVRTMSISFPETVIVCGCGPSLKEECDSLSKGEFVMAADGATSEVVTSGRVPNVIVTDLDGAVEDQIDANLRGSSVFLHAHGDNMGALEAYASRFGGSVVGTCQCPPVPRLVNLGGFTDGDRAICIAQELGAKKVLLAGFDLSRPAPKAGKDPEVKARKLEWAARIMDAVRAQGIEVRPLLDE